MKPGETILESIHNWIRILRIDRGVDIDIELLVVVIFFLHSSILFKIFFLLPNHMRTFSCDMFYFLLQVGSYRYMFRVCDCLHRHYYMSFQSRKLVRKHNIISEQWLQSLHYRLVFFLFIFQSVKMVTHQKFPKCKPFEAKKKTLKFNLISLRKEKKSRKLLKKSSYRNTLECNRAYWFSVLRSSIYLFFSQIYS